MGQAGIKKLSSAATSCVLFLGAVSIALAQPKQEQAWAILNSGVADKDAKQRVAAVTVLGLIQGDAKAATMAEQALQDPDPDVRKAAAGTLGTLKSKSAIASLRNSLKDSDGSVVLAAAKALVMRGSEQGYSVYYQLVTGQHKCQDAGE